MNIVSLIIIALVGDDVGSRYLVSVGGVRYCSILVEQNHARQFVNKLSCYPFSGQSPLIFILLARKREWEREAVNTHKIQISHPKASFKSRRAAIETLNYIVASFSPYRPPPLLPSSLPNLIQHRTPIFGGGETSFLTALKRKLKLPMKEMPPREHISFLSPLWRAGNLNYASQVLGLVFHSQIPIRGGEVKEISITGKTGSQVWSLGYERPPVFTLL